MIRFQFSVIQLRKFQNPKKQKKEAMGARRRLGVPIDIINIDDISSRSTTPRR
jgi:hypothetical protein